MHAYHGGPDDNESYRPIVWGVIHTYGSLVLGQYIGKGGVDGNRVDGVQAARNISDAGQHGACQEMESVIVLHEHKFGLDNWVKADTSMSECSSE